MTEKREYSRDSFDRFGDDLSEDLLRHVSLSDCFAFECVSKQIKRSVFNGQKMLKAFRVEHIPGVKADFKLNEFNASFINSVNETVFECALKKCLSPIEIISNWAFDINDRIIDIIRDNCSQLASIALNSLSINVSPKAWELFGAKLGYSLRRISFKYWYYEVGKESLQTLFRFTPNLVECEEIDLNYLIFKTDESAHVLPKLKKITAIYDNKSDFQSFADIYCDRVETIILHDKWRVIKENTRMPVNFDQLSRFHSLLVLGVESNSLDDRDFNANGLDLIAKNCQQLRELSLESDSKIIACNTYMFVSLKRLTLGGSGLGFPYSYRCEVNLRYFPNLRSLRILRICLRYVHKDYLADIHHCVPKLRCIEVDCGSGVDSHLLSSLALLKELYYAKFSVEIVRVTDSDLRHFINSCQNIRKIDFKSVWSINKRTIYEFVWHAKRLGKCHNYRLKVNVMNSGESVGDSDLNDITSGLPKNVKIEITSKRRYTMLC